MNSFKLSENDKEYVKLQRTGLSINLEETYWNSCKNDWESIKDLVTGWNTVTDIGCGLAGIDTFIAFECPNAEIVLVDSEQTDTDVYYGFKERGSKYNSVSGAVDFLRRNGVENEITFFNVDNIRPTNMTGAVISLISWGFHYPVDEYFKEAIGADMVIMDIRKGTENKAVEMFGSEGFSHSVLLDTQKYFRIAFAKLP